MIGASIYGFVDYKKTSQKKEFTTMYGEEKKKAVVVIADNKTTEPVIKKAITKKQAIGKNEDITFIKHNINDAAVTTKEIKEIEKPVVDIKVSDNSNAVKKVKKKKRFSADLFSRAPIREEEIEIKELEKPVVKKTENKGQ